MNDEVRRQELLKEFEDDYDDYFASGRFNNIADIVLTMLAVVASLAAAVLAGTTELKALAASMAAVPAAVATIHSKVDVRGRSVWYFQCAAQISSLITLLKYSTAPDVDDIVKKRADMESTMETEWSKIGRSAAAPSRRRVRI